MKKKYLKEILVALSLANLLFINSWRPLIYSVIDFYHLKIIPTYLDYISLILLVVSLSFIFISGTWLFRYFNNWKTPIYLKWIFIFCVICLFNVIRVQFYKYEENLIHFVGENNFLIAVGVIGCIALIVIIKWHELVFKVFYILILLFTPFVAITFSQAIFGIVMVNDLEKTNHIKNYNLEKNNLKSEVKSRVVWIIFDELDYKVSFENRPRTIQLSEFDRLKDESFSATNAVAPARRTIDSIPSLLIGKKVRKAKPIGNDLLLKFRVDDRWENFSAISNVFNDIQNLGGKNAVSGFYHPYCRLFNKILSDCHMGQLYFHHTVTRNDNISDAFIDHLTRFIVSIPLGYNFIDIFPQVKLLENRTHKQRVENYNDIVLKSFEVVKNKDADLIFIHLPIPHPPFLYNRNTNDFDEGYDYFDNLILADKILGEIRYKLEKANLWDNSTIIISSDHTWRVKMWQERTRKGMLNIFEKTITKGVEDPRVPFIIKLKNQNRAVTYNKHFNTVISRKLILEIMKGNIVNPLEVKNWLNQNANKD